MSKRLLQRQTELLEYLTSGAAIFGEDGGVAPRPDGLDPTLLRLEAWFSHEKRIEKIRAVFAKTFEILGPAADAVVREFVEACPPASIGRLDNARQLHGFLTNRWRDEPPDPPYLSDIAALELARAQVGAEGGAEPQRGEAPGSGVRRAPGVAMLRCAFDVRPIFEAEPGGAVPVARDTPLAIVMPLGAGHPQIFELAPVVFDLLAALDDVTDPEIFGPASLVRPLIRELAELGLIEECR
jgi:hypothetical protein